MVRTSPVQASLARFSPVLREVYSMPAPVSFSTPDEERQAMAQLALCDVSCLPKATFWGPVAIGWLENAGLTVPRGLHGVTTGKTALLIRTGATECFIEGVMPDIPSAAGVYRTDRQDAGFVLCGNERDKVMRQTCGVDFERQTGFVMTRVAGVSCSILAGGDAYRLWVDPSYGIYLWDALLEIVTELGGRPVGLRAIQNLPEYEQSFPSIGI